MDLASQEDEPGECFAPINGAYSSVIARARLDILGYLEKRDALPPLYFPDRGALQLWAAENLFASARLSTFIDGVYRESGATCSKDQWAKCRGVDLNSFPAVEDNVIRIFDYLDRSYDQLWVRARWNGYRNSFRHWHMLRDGIEQASVLRTLNADHAISRAVLRKMGHNEAWVILFPVEANANQGFGARVEKKIVAQSIAINPDVVSLLSLFKLFMVRMPTCLDKLDLALKDFRGQVRSSDRDIDELRSLLKDFFDG